MEEGQKQEIIEARGYNVKELLHFVDQVPEEPLFKWIVRVTSFGGCVFGFEC